MRSRRTFAVLVTTALVLTGTATSADGATNRLVASWRMNEFAGSRTMIDSSGYGNNGRIGREVQVGTQVNGAIGYRFARLQPDTPPARPEHLVNVPDSSLLDPGDREFAITMRLRTTNKFGNVIQKGQATVAGGNWKIQIPNGIVQCFFRGSRGSQLLSAPKKINNGEWHTVRCERTKSALTLSINGSTVARKAGWTGTIANSWPVTIGGKGVCDQIDVGCDYYAGDLDWLELSTS